MAKTLTFRHQEATSTVEKAQKQFEVRCKDTEQQGKQLSEADFKGTTHSRSQSLLKRLTIIQTGQSQPSDED